MGLPPASFGREREDRSPYPMFQTAGDFAYDQYLGTTGPSASTFYTVPLANSPDYVGVAQVASLGLCTDRHRPVMVSPFRRENKSSRMRKARYPSGTDTVKHRRTRSGCLTCRRRRVKCDEAHPQCERCRKGGRECVFPSDVTKKSSTSASAKSGSQSPDRAQSTLASLSDLDEESEAGDLSTEPFESKSNHEYHEHGLARGRSRHGPGLPSRSESETPSCDSSRSSMLSDTSTAEMIDTQEPQWLPSAENNDWKHSGERLGFYLNYFSSHITHSDYGLVCDPDAFFESTLPQMARLEGSQALLYGVAAFSAYHYALRHAHGCLEEFLEFYNSSVTSVLQTLNGNEVPSLATLVTLLQLSAIEANFSDYPQLVSHHRAASELVPRVCKLDMIGNASVRAVLLWSLHQDNVMSTLCDIKPQLPRSYVVSLALACHEQAKLELQYGPWRLAESYVQLCLIAYDAADHRAHRLQQPDLLSRLDGNTATFRERLYAWRQSLDPAITDSEYLALGQTDPRLSGDITPLGTAHQGSDLHAEPVSGAMMLLAFWHFNVLLYEGMECLTEGVQPSERLTEHALRICQIWSFSNPGPALYPCVSLITPLRTAILFLPQDGHYSRWIRENLARTEALGVMMAQPLRACMANILHDQTCLQWWLPHNEKLTMAIRNARVMADERWALSGAPFSSSSSSSSFMMAPSTADNTIASTYHGIRGHNILLEIANGISRLRGPPPKYHANVHLQ